MDSFLCNVNNRVVFGFIFIQWAPMTDPDSPVPSLIPWQGPFHVSLNADESTVLLFRPFFEKLYKALFGRNKVQATVFSI